MYPCCYRLHSSVLPQALCWCWLELTMNQYLMVVMALMVTFILGTGSSWLVSSHSLECGWQAYWTCVLMPTVVAATNSASLSYYTLIKQNHHLCLEDESLSFHQGQQISFLILVLYVILKCRLVISCNSFFKQYSGVLIYFHMSNSLKPEVGNHINI